MSPAEKNNSANLNGDSLEDFVQYALNRYQYQQVDNALFDGYVVNEHAGVYSRQLKLGLGIYDTKIFCDFAISRGPGGGAIIIECKWQQGAGSVDEKLPFLVENIKKHYPYPTYVIIDGSGFRPGAIKWLRKQIGGKLAGVMSMAEFQAWSNNGSFLK